MLQRTKSAITILASILALMVAVSFYPATAFADTDYEAAYNQAKANTQAAYDAWQTAKSTADNLVAAVNEAAAAKAAAEDAVEPAKQEMDKAHRLLDYKTRQAMDTFAQQAWNRDYGSTISNANWYCNTDARMQAILYDAYGNVSWHGGAKVEIEKFKANSEASHQRIDTGLPYGITTSTSGEDNTESLNLYQKYVYLNESYENLMLTLDYFDEHNAIRNYYKTDTNFDGPTNILVSPYLLIQSATNAPINKYSHSIIAMSGKKQCSQNLVSIWGNTNTPPTYDSNDPFGPLFYNERNTEGGHYINIICKHTHAGMACSWNTSGKTFEQDFANTPNATGYTVEEYRAAINNYAAAELTAYNNATVAYEQAEANVVSSGDAYDAAYAAWWQADRNAQKKEQAYKDAQTAEQEAYNAYKNWLDNQNDEPTQPEDPPIINAQVTGIQAEATSATNLKVTWNAVSNAERYSVHIVGGSEDRKLSASSNSRIIPNCTEGTVYKITVAAVIDGVEGPESDLYTCTFKYNNSGDTPGNPAQPANPAKVTGVKLTEILNNGNPTISVSWNAAENAIKYKVYFTQNGKTSVAVVTKTSYIATNCEAGTTYTFKVSGIASNGAEGEVSSSASITTTGSEGTEDPLIEPADGSEISSTPAPDDAPTVGIPSVGKMKVNKKKKTVDIWFNGAANAQSYRIEVRRAYKLKGKKKIAVLGGWKAYNVSSPYKTIWKYKKKVSAKQAKKYQENSNYRLKKSGKKYKLYRKKSAAPLTVKKLTRKSIYQVRITAYNGSAQKTSGVRTFTIK